jgi:hypothetical protein
VAKYVRLTSCLALTRWVYWQKGLYHVVTPHKADGSLGGGNAVRLIEHGGKKLHSAKHPPFVLPLAQVMDSARYRTVQETAEQRQCQAMKLSAAIQAARAKATIQTERNVEL